MNKKKTIKAALANNKMVQVVARLFGKEEFNLSESGSVELSDEEALQISKTYGEGFLTKLKALNFNTEAAADANDLFNEAVRFQADQLSKEKDTIIAQLRETVETL